MQLAKGGEAFWLNSRTVAHVFEEDDALALYAINIRFEAESEGNPGVLSTSLTPLLIGKFPTKSATNFRYSAGSGYLVFSAYVYSDGNLTAVKDHDKAWETRGNSAFVYDTTYERHWDTWVGPKKNSLFSVRLVQDPDRQWVFGEQFVNLLAGTKHVSLFRPYPFESLLSSLQSCPVEPFGGTDDFDVSRTHVIYTTKDPQLPEAWHTKQNVSICVIANFWHFDFNF